MFKTFLLFDACLCCVYNLMLVKVTATVCCSNLEFQTADYYCELISSTERLVVSNDNEDEDITSQVGNLIEVGNDVSKLCCNI